MAAVGNRSGRAGLRTSRARAANTANGPAGFACSAETKWPCTVASTLVDIPHSGHGTPVRVRSGHGRPACPGSSRENRRGAEHGERRSTRIG